MHPIAKRGHGPVRTVVVWCRLDSAQVVLRVSQSRFGGTTTFFQSRLSQNSLPYIQLYKEDLQPVLCYSTLPADIPVCSLKFP